MLDFRLLGALDLRTSEGVEVGSVLAQPKRVALLAYLVLHAPGSYVRRDSLLALFWPEADTEHARSSLRNGLSYLRRSLGEGVVLTRGDEEVGIDPARLRCDAVEFVRALEEGAHAQALELYRGDLLEGFFLSGASKYEDWLAARRVELRAQACGASWALAFAAEEAGEGERAASFAQRAVALARDEEPAARKLIALLGRLGEREWALRTYEELAERLLREYGAEPSEETRTAVGKLRARSPLLGLSAPPPPAPLSLLREGKTPEPAGAPVGSPELPPSREGAALRAPDDRNRGRVPSERGEGDGPEEQPGEGHESHQSGGGKHPRPDWRRRFRLPGRAPQLAFLLLAVALVATTALFNRQPATPPPDSSDVIAVLPFSYYGSGESRSLAEGIVGLLSTNLDGAGELRSVDARALLSVAEHTGADVSDPQSGRGLAERFGAGLYVLGHIVEAGGRLRITAVIYDRTGARSGASPEQVTVEGKSEQLLPLVDELTTKLLAHRSREPRARIAQLAALTTHSLPALRAFLDGEQHYRRGRYDEAVEAFRQAVGLDTTFALAYYRMSTAAIWASDWEADKVGRESAMHFRERLAPRDRQIVEAWNQYSRQPAAHVEQLYERLIARDPDDVEAWFQLGETHFHWKPMLGYPVLEAREPFKRVLSYEPDNAAALIHLARLAALERDTAHFDALFERVRRLEPGWDQALELEALRGLAFGDAAAREQVRRKLSAASAGIRVRILHSVASYTNDLESAAALARQSSTPELAPLWQTALLRELALWEVSRGRWRAAQEELAALERLRPTQATHYRAVYGALPFLGLSATEVETIRRELARIPTSDADPNTDAGWTDPPRMYAPGQQYLLGLLSVRMHDPVAALRYAGTLERQKSSVDAAYGRVFARILRAEVAWAGGQAQDALDLLGSSPVTVDLPHLRHWRVANAHERWLRAELLRTLGREEEALRWYSSFPDPEGYDLIYLAPSHLRRAEILERMGQRQEAARHYARFVELWKDADAALQPQVGDAARSLARLGGKMAD